MKIPRIMFAPAVALIAACNVIPTTAQSQQPPPRQTQPRPVATQAPQAPVASTTAARSATFTYSGEMTQGGWLRGKVPTGARSLTFDGKDVPIAADGSFIIAFDRDAPLSQTMTARLANGQTVAEPLQLSSRAWDIEHVNVGPRAGAAPSEAYRIRRAAEVEQINAARAIRNNSDGWRQDFIWPVKGRISGFFGNQRIYRGTPGSYHSGMDIATGVSGTPFVAPADGVVVLAAHQPFSLEGKLILIDHGNGLGSAFLHCSSIVVNVGDVVRQGQHIGNIGSTGRSTGPHLHWGMKWFDRRIDPILFSGPMN